MHIKIIEDVMEKDVLNGMENHTASLIMIDRIGLNLNIKKFDLKGVTASFEKSLIASLKGWRMPITLTLLGPLRSWE